MTILRESLRPSRKRSPKLHHPMDHHPYRQAWSQHRHEETRPFHRSKSFVLHYHSNSNRRLRDRCRRPSRSVVQSHLSDLKQHLDRLARAEAYRWFWTRAEVGRIWRTRVQRCPLMQQARAALVVRKAEVCSGFLVARKVEIEVRSQKSQVSWARWVQGTSSIEVTSDLRERDVLVTQQRAC